MAGALAGLAVTFTRKKLFVARKALCGSGTGRKSEAMDAKTASRLLFAVTVLAIGCIGLIGGDFAPIWEPVPKTVPAREVLTYLCTVVALTTGAGMIFKRSAAPAAAVLLVYLLIWTVLFKARFIVRAPLEEVSYQSTGENLVLIAAAWAIFAEVAKGPHLFAGEAGRRIAFILYGLALIAFGLSHFFYLQMTAPLVPRWLPGPVFWAYLTGAIYLACGFAIVANVAARLGATTIAVQITLITFLVWGPMLFTGNLSAMHWRETVVSCGLTAAAWVLAASFEGQPWLAPFGRRRLPARDQ
jgi:uncharacterized membrane protein